MDRDCPLSDEAEVICRLAGWTNADAYSKFIIEVIERNEHLLIGGYGVDLIIVAAYATLENEMLDDQSGSTSHDTIMARINAILDAAYPRY